MTECCLYSSILFLISCLDVFGQSGGKIQSRAFDEPWITDSASTMLIPYRYDARLFSSNKMATSGDYYANFIVYDFKSDNYRTLFPADTYIKILEGYSYYSRGEEKKNSFSADWIFYLVKSDDYNGNNKIDEQDPFVLYVSNRQGGNLRAITKASENVVSFTIFEKLGFVLLKIQRDENQNKDFEPNDNDRYLVKLSLLNLSFGNKIEARQP